MPSARHSAVLIAAATAAMLVTMGLHPTGEDVVRYGSVTMARGVHLLAIVAVPVLLAGLLGLSRVLRARGTVASLALVMYALAGFCVTIAAAMSGLIAADLVLAAPDASAAQAELLHAQLHLVMAINGAFATLYVGLAGLAIILWSWAMRKHEGFPNVLAVFGVLLGAAGAIVMLGDIVPLSVHGFGAVVAAQAVWTLWTAWCLWRLPEER